MGMNPKTYEDIINLNPWITNPKTYKPRLAGLLPKHFIPRIQGPVPDSDGPSAKLIVGPRQSGKTSLVWSILKDRPPQSVLFLNGEERVVRMWANSAGLMAANIREAFPEVTTLFFDEAQHIEDAGLLIKGLIDSGHGFDVWVTGSSAFHLMDKTREIIASVPR